MSSHYFVKEGQEPALIILDPVPFKVAADLLAWAPLVVVSDWALESVVTWGIKIDALLDLSGDQRRMEKLLSDQLPVHLIAAADKISGLREVFRYLGAEQNSAVSILTFSAAELLPLVDGLVGLDLAVQDGAMRWSRIGHDFQKWLPSGTVFKIFSPAGTLPDVQGAQKINGMFETTADGMVRFKPVQPVWIGESLN